MTNKPVVVCNTEGMAEEEWLKWRMQGIGGSDAGTVLGINPWKTKRELFFEKTGVQPVNVKEKSTLALKWGHVLENTVAEEFSNATGLRVYSLPEMYRHSEYPFMQANVDRFIDLPDGTIGILECKTGHPLTKSKWENGKIPPHYEAQVRHYQAVMNIDVAYIACLFENSSDTMAIRRIDRDLEKEQQLIEAEREFWEECVLTGTVPPFTEDPSLCFETIDKFVQAQLDKAPVTITGFDESLAKIAELKAKKKALDDEAKVLEKEADALLLPIIEFLGEKTAGTATVDGVRYDVSYSPTERTGINKEALKKLQYNAPDIYDTYVTTTVSRRLSFKAKKV